MPLQLLFIIDKERYKIQNDPSNSKSREKATLRQKCAQSVVSDGNTPDFVIFVFTTQKLAFMLQTAHRAEQKTPPSQLFGIFPKPKRVSTENKGRNEYKCTNERYFTPQTTDFKPFLIFFFPHLFHFGAYYCSFHWLVWSDRKHTGGPMDQNKLSF